MPQSSNKNFDQSNDTADSLLDITRREGKDLVSLLLEIQDFCIPQQKMLWIIKELECLSLELSHKRKRSLSPENGQTDGSEDPPFWHRETIDAFEQSNFLALSYTWGASEYEVDNPRDEGHLIQTRCKTKAFSSPVRNSVFQRVSRYMRRHQVSLLWIDRHCIPQRVCKYAVCEHDACNKKRDALETMDLVYSLSSYPVALLGRPIKSFDELKMLAAVLDGSLVNASNTGFRLSPNTTYQVAKRTLQLLCEITADKWWTRAWTFQENYRAGTRMVLLIHHGRDLEEAKLAIRHGGQRLFDRVPGELSVNSVHLFESATQFCLALQSHPQATDKDTSSVQQILKAAGKYTILLKQSDSMSATIVSDILARGATDSWDILAIIGNCCRYAMRFNTGELQNRHEKQTSLSLTILCLCLLNGEIFRYGNGEDDINLTHGMKTVDFLGTQLFNQFQSPISDRSLSFRKGYRFVDVRLTERGIKTAGYLWKLGRSIMISAPPLPTPEETQDEVQGQDDRLSQYQVRRLRLLIEEMGACGYQLLVAGLERFLERDDSASDDEDLFSLRYMRIMARELVRAMDTGRQLTLGCLDNSGVPNQVSPYRAIFVQEKGCAATKNVNESDGLAQYVFTSFSADNPRTDESDGNDLNRHVSLGVRNEGFLRAGLEVLPHLYAENWVFGMCFPGGVPTLNAVFPWPRSLAKIGL